MGAYYFQFLSKTNVFTFKVLYHFYYFYGNFPAFFCQCRRGFHFYQDAFRKAELEAVARGAAAGWADAIHILIDFHMEIFVFRCILLLRY